VNKILEIIQHDAIGDFIICNGLIRELVKKYIQEGYVKFVIRVKDWQKPTVSFMYRDLKEMEIQAHSEICNYTFDATIKINMSTGEQGLRSKNIFPKSVNWDATFYAGYDIDFTKRWSSFKCDRDLNREEELYKKLNPDNLPFIFIHNKYTLVKTEKIRKDLFVIDLTEGHTDNIFDYLTLLEKAEEIHACDSCIVHLVESYPNVGKKLFYHNYPSRSSGMHWTPLKVWYEPG